MVFFFIFFLICFIISFVILILRLLTSTPFDSDTEEVKRMYQKRAEMFADFLETQKQMRPIIDAKFKRDAERLMKLIDKCKEE